MCIFIYKSKQEKRWRRERAQRGNGIIIIKANLQMDISLLLI
jgi:hypothetical protein